MGRHGENIRKRQDGRWEARLLIGREANGKPRYRYFYGKSYKEARDKRNLFEQQLPNQPQSEDAMKDYLFGQLMDDWLFSIRSKVKESTYAKYVFIAERHIRPSLGNITVAGLTTADMNNFIEDKLANGKLNGPGGLSPKTINSFLSVVKLVLAYGVDHDCFASRKLVIHNVRQPQPDIQVLQLSEQERLEQYLLKNLTSQKLGILISLYTGLRLGEVCALQWGDIDFNTNTLYVNRTLMRIQDTDPLAEKKTKIIIDKPKTSKSYRAIPLPQFLADLLKAHHRPPEIYVVTGKSYYKETRNLYTAYKRIMKHIGLEKYTFHALRHTFATRCIENGFDAKSLSEILGHADINITLRRYVHPSMDLKRQQMERLKNVGLCGQIGKTEQ